MKMLCATIFASVMMVFTAVAENPSTLALVETGGSIGTDNMAASGTAFAWDDISAQYPVHAIVNLNDGKFGNSNSWLGFKMPAANIARFAFIGIAFKDSVSVGGIAWGRDNQDKYKDRCLGTYTVQYTTAANPGKDTPDSEWKTIGSITYDDKTATPWLRHKYSFPSPVAATAIRLLVPSIDTCVDELEIYPN